MEIAVLEGESELIDTIKNDFGKYEVNTNDADIGNGADIWITIIGIVGLFFLGGKKINENLDAWIEIGKKISNLFNKKNKPMFIDKEVFIDKDAAIALSINKINEKTEISKIELIQQSELIEKNQTTKDFNINFNPYNYYILVFKVNHDEQFIFCVKSNGEIKLMDYFEATEWNFDLDWESHNKRKDYYS